MAIILGPILQFRGIRDGRWQVSVLAVCDVDAAPALVATLPFTVRKIAALPFSRPAYHVFRFDLSAPLSGETYSIVVGGRNASFSVPAADNPARLAYVSCNGFSDAKAQKKIDANERWRHLSGRHDAAPYQILLMGGDQIYSDSIWSSIGELQDWLGRPLKRRLNQPLSNRLNEKIDRLFCELYLQRWAQAEVAQAFATIPTLMMWDDHDIMDGWGSYPQDQHESKVFQGIFAIAKNYFRALQLQIAADETHPLAIPGQSAFNLGCADIGGGIALLALDLRSERQPQLKVGADVVPEQIMSQPTTKAVLDWLAGIDGHRHLLVMSSIPVCYLNLGSVEKLLGTLPGQQELEDDLRDHWRSNAHQGERKRLIHNLLNHARDKTARVTLLSGDVHVGALAVLQSSRAEHGGNAAVINQLIASGVVHPAPPALVLFALEHIGADPETVDRDIVVRMQPIADKGGYLISRRNWLAIEPEADGRIWANWHLENEPVPVTKVIHPVLPAAR